MTPVRTAVRCFRTFEVPRGGYTWVWLAGAMIVAGTLMCWRGTLRADMSTHFGLSPRGIGMGNAGSAVVDDYAGVFYNPAALALNSTSSFTFGYFYTMPRVKILDIEGKERLGFTTHMNAPVIGYRQNLKNVFPDSWERNIIVALCVSSSDNLKTGTLVETKLYSDPQIPVIGRVQDMLVMSGGVGVELHDYVLLGAGMRFAATYDATNMTATMNLASGETVVEKLAVNADTEIQPILGMLIRPLDRLRLAGVWRRGGSPIKLLGKGSGTAQVGNLVIPMSLSLAFRDFFTPNEFAGAVAVMPSTKVLLALELTYAQWSKYDVPFGQTPPGDPFEDTVITRFGAEYAVSETLTTQVGYYWQPSPVKRFQPYTHYLDTDEHVFSAALQYAWKIPGFLKYPILVSLYFQYQYLPRRTLETIHGPVSIHGYITNVGATVGFRFR